MNCARHMADCTDPLCPTHAPKMPYSGLPVAESIARNSQFGKFKDLPPGAYTGTMAMDDDGRIHVTSATPVRPPAPSGSGHAWYRGWEVGYDADADYWSGEGWIAYKGGCDLGAAEVRSATYEACLDLIDDEESD